MTDKITDSVTKLKGESNYVWRQDIQVYFDHKDLDLWPILTGAVTSPIDAPLSTPSNTYVRQRVADNLGVTPDLVTINRQNLRSNGRDLESFTTMIALNFSAAAAAAAAAKSSSSSLPTCSCNPAALNLGAWERDMVTNSGYNLWWLVLAACVLYLVTIISNHYLKEKELELKAFTTASQSVQETLNLDYLIRKPKALKVVMVKTKEAAHQDAGKT